MPMVLTKQQKRPIVFEFTSDSLSTTTYDKGETSMSVSLEGASPLPVYCEVLNHEEDGTSQELSEQSSEEVSLL